MTHLAHGERRLLNRVRRLKGQVLALEKALESGADDCLAVLTQIAAVRGGAQGLLMEVLGEHLREHVAGERDAQARSEEAEAVIGALRSFLR